MILNRENLLIKKQPIVRFLATFLTLIHTIEFKYFSISLIYLN